MRRTTVTITADLHDLLEESAQESVLRRALERWLTERNEPLSTLRSEGGRIRVLLQVAADALRERALDIGYQEMAQWWVETDHARRSARDAALHREAGRWAAEDAAEDGEGDAARDTAPDAAADSKAR